MTSTSFMRSGLLAAALVFAVSCGGTTSRSLSGGGGAGARTGGAQDIGLARAKVDAGIIPSADDFPLEGLYAEHDLPVDGAPCTDTLCVRAGAAIAARPDAPDAGPGDVAYVQLGLSSNIDLDTFHRQPLNAALVIDTSCSMDGEKIEAVKTAAAKLVDQLNDGDVLTLVHFDTWSETLVGPEAVTNKERFKAKIRDLHAANATCIECGLKDGIAAVQKRLDATRQARIFLLTDEQPNVGMTGSTEFSDLLDAEAKEGVFVSLFGVGLDFGQDAATRISSVKGANYTFLETPEKMSTVFDHDFDLLVTPVAFDLDLALTPTLGGPLQALYGVPGATPYALKTKVATVFLSRSRGAIVAQLQAVSPATDLATASLSFTGTDGQPRQATLAVQAPAGAAPSFSGSGVRRTVALTRFGIGARTACERYAAGDRAGASQLASTIASELSAEVTATGDTELSGEVAFAQRLAALLATP